MNTNETQQAMKSDYYTTTTTWGGSVTYTYNK